MPPKNVRLLYADNKSRIVPFEVLKDSRFFNAIYHDDVTCMSDSHTVQEDQDHVILDTFPEIVVTHAIDTVMFTYQHGKNPTPDDIPELPTDCLKSLMDFAILYDL